MAAIIAAVLSALLSGGLAFLGVVYSSNKTADKMQAQLEKAQAVSDTKIDELTREVREHNGFARRMPVVEEQVRVINHRLKDLEDENKHKGGNNDD